MGITSRCISVVTQFCTGHSRSDICRSGLFTKHFLLRLSVCGVDAWGINRCVLGQFLADGGGDRARSNRVNHCNHLAYFDADECYGNWFAAVSGVSGKWTIDPAACVCIVELIPSRK